ncbi:MAG: DUF1365 domain-containing protein [Proteobacteria bacterium]|nr:DUF1365 domain-containing protein [Pseudomonadota bacterium]
MNSAIYTGDVYHRRFTSRGHTFRYKTFYLLLDLDELLELDQVSRLFGIDRPAWFSFLDTDHGMGRPDGLRAWLNDALLKAGYGGGDWRFRILTMPRMFGYVFNPISVVFCRRADSSAGAMIYEVNNTFGERIAYVAPVGDTRGRIRQRCDKAMFVSPFFDLQGYYEFLVDTSNDRMQIAIDYFVDGERQLHAGFNGNLQPFGSAALRKLAVTHPAATVKVIAGIHFEAFRLWLRGFPLARRACTQQQTSIGTEL